MSAHLRLDGLLCCGDEKMLRMLRPALDSFAIETQICMEPSAAVDAVSQRRLDAVIVDWSAGCNPLRILRATRNSSWNRQATILAMVNAGEEMRAALRAGANFLIHNPSDLGGVSRCLRAAYGTMLLLRRKVARCPVDIPVLAKFSEEGNIEARVTDISLGGLALQTKQPLEMQRQVSLSFMLPATDVLIHIAGTVVNADKNGRVGICFEFVPDSDLKFLEKWLAAQFVKLQEAEIPTSERTVSVQ